MTNFDLVTKKSVLELIEVILAKYGIDYKPGGEIETYGLSAELPQAIECLPPEFDVSSVIQNIQDGESLNIPHRGYCINKDTVIRMITDAAMMIGSPAAKPITLLDDIDKAIQFLSLQTFCVDDCWGTNCKNCNRYKAKQNAMIALNYFRKAEEKISLIHKLKAESTSIEEREVYSKIEDMFKDVWEYSHDRKNLC